MSKEFWTALVDAVVLAIGLILPQFVEAEWANILLKIIAAFQPVVLLWILKMYGNRMIKVLVATILGKK